MNDSDYDQSFIQNIKAETEMQGANNAPASKNKRKFVIFAIILAVILIGVIVVVSVFTKKPKAEEQPETVGFRMTCSGEGTKYEFYKNNTYKILDEDTNAEVESGSYSIDVGLVTLKGGEKERKAAYVNGKIADNEKIYVCEEPTDAQTVEN